MRAGEGRVAMFGEAAMFTAQLRSDGSKMGMNAPYAEQNYKFLLNVSHWLSGLLDPATPPLDTTKPTITLTTPAEGATYSLNQAVNAGYSCQDEAGGSGLKNCQGTVASGSAIDTASTGTKTFTVTATDNAGNQDSVTRTYSVAESQPPADTTPPETTINSGPQDPTNNPSASFAFSSDEAGSTFECSLDGDAFASCSSPKSYTNLADGSHTFSVRAVDAAGNTDATPASRTWTVDTAAPDTTIGSGPSGTITVAEATFSFSSEAGVTFECRLDGAAYSACTSPRSYTNLSNGPHTFDVRAKDGAGNVNATPASRTFTVNVPPPPQDTTPPDTIVDSGPSGTIKQNSATFTFSSSEAGSTFECSLDSAAFSACSSPKKYTGLANGPHTLKVRAKDAAGNTDASPASRTWTVRR
jgi:hypothetical protein